MNIAVWSVIRDEAKIIDYFIRHYLTFASDIYLIDGGSVDGTLLAINNWQELYPDRVHLFEVDQKIIDDDVFLKMYYEVPKNCSGMADYIISVDCDEFVYPNLDCLNGQRLVKTQGWQMISETFPTTTGQIYEEIREGIRDSMHDKPIIWKPGVSLKFAHGRHSVIHSEVAPAYEERIKLLHFRFLSMDYVKSRHSRNWANMCQASKDVGSGIHDMPGWDGYQSIRWYEQALKDKRPCLGS